MLTKKILINNKHGIHARPSSKIFEIVSEFNCTAKIKYGQNEADASSIMNLILLAVEPNSTIELEVDGEDQQPAFDKLVEYLEITLPKEEHSE